MKFIECFLAISMIFILVIPAYATKYAGEPFSLGVGAGPLGMGGAVIAGPFNATSGYWNPAGLAYTSGRQIMTMHSETFGSLLNHDFIGFSSNSGKSTGLNSYGAYLYYLGGGGIKITEFDPQSQYPVVVREENHFDIMLGGSLAGKYRDNVSYGITAKIIYRDIAVETAYGLGLDAGVVYKVDTIITAALVVTDLTSTFLAYSNDNTETIYPAVKPGMSIRFAHQSMTALATGQVIFRFEGRKQNAELWQGEISADFQAGLQLGYKDIAFGRIGYDQSRFTAGLGAIFDKYIIDLAYLHHSDFDETFRISAGINF
ncbi:MAG: hypothetical protein V3V99_11860 [candidate division Zixibacteria bacterium]